MEAKDLKTLNACEGGYLFAATKSSLLEAWETCERGDWMLWFAQKLNCPLQLLSLAKGKCAGTVIHLMKDEISINAVKVAIDFGNGIATRKELNAAAYAAFTASDAAARAAAAYADDAASDTAAYAAAAAAYADAAYAAAAAAAYADDAASDTAAYAAAAYAAAAAADDAAAGAASKENQLQTANICREILTDFIKSKI